MKASPAKGAFADPQSLVASPSLAAALTAQFEKSCLQVDQRLAQFKLIFLDSYLFPDSQVASAEGLAARKIYPGVLPTPMQILDHTFGAGLDFLLSWKLWLQARQANPLIAPLNYFAICAQPLALEDLKRVHQHWPHLNALSLQLQDQYPHAMKGFYQLDFDGVKLTVVQAEAEQALAQVQGDFDVCLGKLRGWLIERITGL